MKKWSGNRLFVAAVSAMAAACAEQGRAPGLPGYQHTFANSRFITGDVISKTDQFGMHKIVGSVGTFSTQLVSGAVVAQHNGPLRRCDVNLVISACLMVLERRFPSGSVVSRPV